MTADLPRVSVIMATWGRGRHILPSIKSVLRQDASNFELIVAGDGCQDETEAVVAGIRDPRLRWINLPQRIGSQSGPNNAGIAAAKAEIIAYIGHDDIWEPEHLTALLQGFAAKEAPDFVVSGLLAHPPAGIPWQNVLGMFTDDAAKHDYFFPPSSFAHRRSVIDRIGPWHMPQEIQAPVDEDFLIRAAKADLRFLSTLKVTVHKFTASFRYLSYLRHESHEQEAQLAEIAAPGHGDRLAEMVERARKTGRFMHQKRRDFSTYAPGQLARQNAARRGVNRAETVPIGAGVVLRQKPDFCAYDWADRPILGLRRHGSNPRPRVLVPVTATGPVRMSLRIAHFDRKALGPLSMLCNDVPVTALPKEPRPSIWGWVVWHEVDVELLPDKPTVLELILSPELLAKADFGFARLGLGIGQIRLVPSVLPTRDALRHFLS